MPHRPAPRFVVSDVDGTLIDHRERISPALRECVANLSSQGVVFTLATGRPARWLLPVLEQLPVRPVCVCANGAVTYDSATDSIVATRTLDPDVLEHIIRTVHSEHPHLGFAVERAGASAFDRPNSLFAVTENYDHAWDSEEHSFESLTQLSAQPAVKLLIRHATWTSSQLFELINPMIDPRIATATFSWEGGLVEISAPGVSKRLALEELAAGMGVENKDVIAFGDMPNDIEMLTWAGWGVAMGNAHEKVAAIADEITTTNDEDGVARVLGRWF